MFLRVFNNIINIYYKFDIKIKGGTHMKNLSIKQKIIRLISLVVIVASISGLISFTIITNNLNEEKELEESIKKSKIVETVKEIPKPKVLPTPEPKNYRLEFKDGILAPSNYQDTFDRVSEEHATYFSEIQDQMFKVVGRERVNFPESFYNSYLGITYTLVKENDLSFNITIYAYDNNYEWCRKGINEAKKTNQVLLQHMVISKDEKYGLSINDKIIRNRYPELIEIFKEMEF
jgi:hypothetical protein